MRDAYGIVYTVTHPKDPGRIRYVGKTINTLRRRENGHWSDANRRRSNSRFQNWLIKYRDDREDILFSEYSKHYSKGDLDQAEIRLISELRALGQADLNITAGGDGGFGLPWSEESRAKLSDTLSGEGAWKALLTWEDVANIRERYTSGDVLGEIVKDYPLTKSSMSKVLRNDTWKDPDYTPPTREEVQQRQNPNWVKLTPEQVGDLRRRSQGEIKTFEEWGREYGVNPGVARAVLTNKTHHDPEFDIDKVLRKQPRRPLRKLTEEGVRRIRRERDPDSETWRRYAEEFEITPGAVYRVWSGAGWKGIC